MQTVQTKKIKILSSGPIPVRGFFYGPILTPYDEKVSTIFSLLTARINVVEVLNDGSEITLTLTNYNVNNNIDDGKQQPPVNVEETKVETVDAPVVTTPDVDEPTSSIEDTVIAPVDNVDSEPVTVNEDIADDVVTEEPDTDTIVIDDETVAEDATESSEKTDDEQSNKTEYNNKYYKNNHHNNKKRK